MSFAVNQHSKWEKIPLNQDPLEYLGNFDVSTSAITIKPKKDGTIEVHDYFHTTADVEWDMINYYNQTGLEVKTEISNAVWGGCEVSTKIEIIYEKNKSKAKTK